MLNKFKRWLVLKIIGDKCAMFNCVIENHDASKLFGVQSDDTDFMIYNVHIITNPRLKTSLVYSQNYYRETIPCNVDLVNEEYHTIH